MIATRGRRLLTFFGFLILMPSVLFGIAAAQDATTGISTTETIVAIVDNQPVTLSEFQQGVEYVEGNLAYIEAEIHRQEQEDPESPQLDVLQAFSTMIEESGVQNAALGALIHENALYARAIAEGHEPDPKQVAEQVTINQSIVESNSEAANAIAPDIAAYGEERYWSEIHPELIRQNFALTGLQNEVLSEVPSPEMHGLAWTEFGIMTVAEAPVEVLDPEAIAPATVDGAYQYLIAYWELQFQY